MEKKTMRLKDASNYVISRLTQNQAAKVLGITPNQVYKYATGYTKTCSDKVIDAFYDKFDIYIEGQYNSEEEYLKFRKLREE